MDARERTIKRMVAETVAKASLPDPDFAQGARCGHLEGRGRAGQYVIGEEMELSWDAADAQGLDSPPRARRWADGYRHGYKLAAEGSELEAWYRAA